MISSLEVNVSVKLDASGNGTARLTPPSGILWLPTQVRVQNTSVVKFPTASVYTGSQTYNDQLIDTTTTNVDDSTGRIQGIQIFPGQVIAGVWTGGDVGAIATVTVYGLQVTNYRNESSNNIPTFAPGPAFPTRINPVQNLDLPVLIDSVSFLSIPTNANTFFPGGLGTIGTSYSMAQFQSFRMKLNCSGSGTKPYFGIQFEWYSDSSLSNQIFTDYFTFSSNANDQYGVGIVRAPYLLLRIFNYDSISSSFSFNLYGSQRTEPRVSFRTLQSAVPAQGLGVDNIVFDGFFNAVAAGTHVNSTDFNFWNGPVTLNAWVSTTPTATKVVQIVLYALPNGVLTDDQIYEVYIPQSVADFKSPVQVNLAFPRRVVGAKITNNDTIANNVHLGVIGQEL